MHSRSLKLAVMAINGLYKLGVSAYDERNQLCAQKTQFVFEEFNSVRTAKGCANLCTKRNECIGYQYISDAATGECKLFNSMNMVKFCNEAESTEAVCGVKENIRCPVQTDNFDEDVTQPLRTTRPTKAPRRTPNVVEETGNTTLPPRSTRPTKSPERTSN